MHGLLRYVFSLFFITITAAPSQLQASQLTINTSAIQKQTIDPTLVDKLFNALNKKDGGTALSKLLAAKTIPDVNARLNYARAPLAHAVFWATPLTLADATLKVEMLIKAGALPDPKHPLAGTTPLIEVATYAYCNEIARILIDAGANVNELDNDGNTPLITAAQANNKTLIEMLFSKGAKRTIINRAGKTFEDYGNYTFKEMGFLATEEPTSDEEKEDGDGFYMVKTSRNKRQN